ncbi:MAG: hypothetical protein GY694_17375, partial [Gammaproteobacteria bacterium]|nr:hypothetical protein [Gammaproteobacteria bacterium]
MKTHYLGDSATARPFIEWLLKQGELGIDIETAPLPEYAEDKKAGLDPYKSYPRLFQAATAGGDVAVFDL